MLLTRTTETTGSDILARTNEVLADLAAQAQDRDAVINERLAALEAEQADVRQAQRKLAAAQVA